MGLREQLAARGSEFVALSTDGIIRRVTKIPEPVTKIPETVTEIAGVTKKRGRPKTGMAMTPTERKRKSRAKAT